MKFWHYMILIGAAVLLVGSFFLPNAVAGVTDSQRLNKLTMIDSQSISFDSTPELALVERITLVANPNTKILPLKTGNVMDFDTAKKRVDRELERLFRGTAFQFDFDKYSVDEGAAAIVIDDTTPTLSSIIWELVLTDESKNTVIVTLDDETGYILKVIYRLGNKNNSIVGAEFRGSLDNGFYSIAKILAEMMDKYYNMSVTMADYQFSSNIAYYRADLFIGGRAIPMYGAVRATSFTINERV